MMTMTSLHKLTQEGSDSTSDLEEEQYEGGIGQTDDNTDDNDNITTTDMINTVMTTVDDSISTVLAFEGNSPIERLLMLRDAIELVMNSTSSLSIINDTFKQIKAIISNAKDLQDEK